MTAIRLFWPLVAAVALLLTPGCALFKPGVTTISHDASETTESVLVPPAPAMATVGASAAADSAAAAAAVAKSVEVDSLDRKDLPTLSRLVVQLPYADVVLGTSPGFRKGQLRITKTAGEARCKVRVSETEKGLEITEPPKSSGALSAVGKAKSALPPVSGCRFGIEIGLREAAMAVIELTRGSLAVEAWSAPLEVKMDWGDVDVGTVGALNVTCGRCTLTGEGVDGPLSYKLERGNVGLAGLSGSVVGSTFGDTVLKWRRLKSDSSVKLVSQAGDVILFFPESVPLAIDLKAPRGDVNSHFQTGAHGVPVLVTAELGNVRVYRAGKIQKSQ